MNCFTPSHVLLASLLLTTPVVMADTLRVPEDYPTIQEAATASTNGDIIDLGPGTWFQNVYGLSGVTLKGRDGAEKTIIDGTGHDWSPIVMYGDPCTIEGITFRNGVGSDIFGLVRGGAIYVEFTSATIRDCRFENNIINGGQNTTRIGGAICGFYSDLFITNCDFVANGAEMGGAIHVTNAGMLEVNHSRFRRNTAWQGGAISVDRTPFTINSCLFHDNLAEWQGGGLHVSPDNPDAPAIPGQIENSNFIRNHASEYGYGAGGGMAILGNHDISVTGCSFQDNYGYTGGGIYAGWLAEGDSPVPVSNSMFCGNFFADYSNEAIEEDGSNSYNTSCWCSADINADEVIDVNDLLLLLNAWGGFYTPELDANNDGFFDVNDILAVVEAWGRDCYDNS